MKILLLLLALLLVSGLASAQALRPAAASPDSHGAALPTPPAAPDTVAALHRLFAAKRKKLTFILLGTVAAEVTGQVIIGSTVEGGGIIDGRVLGQFAAALLAVPVVIGEVLFYAQYNQKHEQRALDKFQAHQLPRHLTRQLKARYFG